jgi:hypothetical protein
MRRFVVMAIASSATGDAFAQQVIPRQKKATEIETDTPATLAPGKFRAGKERILDETIEITRTALEQVSVRNALEWQGEFPQSTLLRAIEIPILPAHLDDTRYDVSDLRRRYPVQIGLRGAADDSNPKHVSSARVIASIDKDYDAVQKGRIPAERLWKLFLLERAGHDCHRRTHCRDVL